MNLLGISIEGTLLMLDDATPHVAVPVQAICDGKVIATTLSDENGKYQFINLKPGQYQVRCQVLGGYVYYGEERRGRSKGEREQRGDGAGEQGRKGAGEIEGEEAGERGNGDILRVESGKTLKGIDFRFAPFKKGIWRNYSYLDGLTRDWIFSIYCDSEGILWFGSEIGAFRYDGREFIHFTQKDGLPYGHLFPIVRGPDGMMWFGIIEGGVSRYDGKEFVTFTTEDGLVHNSVFAIHCDPDGVLWFGTWGGGVSRYDGKTFVNFTTQDGLVHNHVSAIYRDPDGVMWFGTWGGGVSRYDGKEFVNFTTEDGLAHNFIHAIHCDPDGVMWFATFGGWDSEEGGGLSRYDGNGFINLTTEDGLAHNSVFTIHCDPDGVMWFGTYGGGVSRYDGETFVNFTTEDGLADNHVYSICCDPDGVMWFATNRGVSRYDPNVFINLTTQDGLASNWVNAIYRDPDGAMWFATRGGGVSWYDGKEFISFTTEDGLAHNAINDIYRDPDDVIWFATGDWFTGGGISRYDGKEFVNFTTKDGLAHNHVSAICSDLGGVICFGTYGGGVSRYDGKEFINLTTEDGLVDEYVNSIYRDPDDVLWFGTGWSRSRGGVSQYDGNTFVNYTTEDGLAGDAIFAIYRDPDGVMWFGTTGGLSRYDGKEFANFTREDGLAHDNVNTIYRGPDGVMWFGTDGGVSAYDGIAWASLDTRDGLAGRCVVSILQDPDGSLWFGTEGGVTRYRRSTTPPRAYIVSVTTDQIYHDISDIPAFTPGTRVTIEYDSIDLKTLPEKRQYRCRVYETSDVRHQTSDREVESHVSSLRSDVPYSLPTRNTTFDWTPEEPGTYIFEVQAIDRDLNYSEPATVSFTIEPDPVLVSMQAELNYLRSEAGRKYQFESIIGSSDTIMQVRGLMEKAIESRLAVLITGETGTGKELVAKAIHHNSPRKDRPLLAMNCGAIPRELLASELFGHRKGAFTGAREDKMGLFEAASGGTVILDEISEMSEDAQVYLLRVLEERVVQRLGEHISRDVDVRVIAIANKDLMIEVSEGRFREDLYYRLSVFPVYIPPLRERIEDIPPLAEHFLQDMEKELDGFAPDVFQVLQSYSWPGNVRELRNAVHRAAALAEGEIQTYHFPPEITRGESLIQDAIASQSGYSVTVKSFQRRFIEQVLRECDGNRHEAARRLKMNRSNLLRLIKRFGIS